MLVVIAIIAILAALLFPALTRAKNMAKSIACLSNVRQLGTAWILYAGENDSFVVQYNTYWVAAWNGSAMPTWPEGYYTWPTKLKPMLNQPAIPLNGTLDWYWKETRTPIFRCPMMPEKPEPPQPNPDSTAWSSYGLYATGVGGMNVYLPDGSAAYGVNRITDIIRPEGRLVFADACYYSTSGGHFQPSVGNYYFYIHTQNPAEIQYMERPAFRHSQRINAVFADGHAGSVAFTEVYVNDHQLRSDWYVNSPLRLK